MGLIEAPFLVGFSCYMWNVEYNLALAKMVKEKWPDCIIAFGGPHVPNDRSYLDQYEQIDILLFGEGERVFYALLSSFLKNEPLSTVGSIAFRCDGDVVETDKVQKLCDCDYPSPYANGYFDYILDDERYRDYQFDAVLETSRGCPYNCAYCYFIASGRTLRKFSDARVKADLDWMAQHKIVYVLCADANFGIFERDEETTDYIISLNQRYGYPKRVETTTAKNGTERTFRINRKFETAGLSRGISLDVQSMNPQTLEYIGRKNLTNDNFKEMLNRYNRAGMHTYTDILLGLPGETFESFCKGICEVIEAGQHTTINVYRVEILPNTLMSDPDYRAKHKIVSIKSHLKYNHTLVTTDATADGAYASSSEISVGSSTMTTEQWAMSQKIAVCIQSFHCFGLLRYLAFFLRNSCGVSYYDFYMELFRWIGSESKFICRALEHVCHSIEPFLRGEEPLNFWDERFGKIYWAFEEGMFLTCCAELDRFYDDVKTYLKRFDTPQAMLEDLLCYQKACVVRPDQPAFQQTFAYNWTEYFSDMNNFDRALPAPQPTVLSFAGCELNNWVDYAREIVWFGKRGNKMIDTGTAVIQDEP